jgi:prefoldin subunit 5
MSLRGQLWLLESDLQDRYERIRQFQQRIEAIQRDLGPMEEKFLKLKARIDNMKGGE